MNDDLIREQIDSLIRDEIQEVINEYIDSKENSNGFSDDNEKELKVNISNREVEKLLKKYKKLKKQERSNLTQIKKLGLVDKHGKPLS